MFGRKKDEANETETAPAFQLRPRAFGAAPAEAAPLRPVQPPRPEPIRSMAAPMPTPPAAAPAPAAKTTGPDPKVLIVGQEISLNGQITACDRLVVEGRVEATLQDTRSIEISQTGTFKGTAEIEDADIRGTFEGELSVKNRLFIRASGKVIGKIRYGQIEVECGGQLSGTVETTGKSA